MCIRQHRCIAQRAPSIFLVTPKDPPSGCQWRNSRGIRIRWWGTWVSTARLLSGATHTADSLFAYGSYNVWAFVMSLFISSTRQSKKPPPHEAIPITYFWQPLGCCKEPGPFDLLFCKNMLPKDPDPVNFFKCTINWWDYHLHVRQARWCRQFCVGTLHHRILYGRWQPWRQIESTRPMIARAKLLLYLLMGVCVSYFYFFL